MKNKNFAVKISELWRSKHKRGHFITVGYLFIKQKIFQRSFPVILVTGGLEHLYFKLLLDHIICLP